MFTLIWMNFKRNKGRKLLTTLSVSCPSVRGNLPSGFVVKNSENGQLLCIGIMISD